MVHDQMISHVIITFACGNNTIWYDMVWYDMVLHYGPKLTGEYVNIKWYWHMEIEYNHIQSSYDVLWSSISYDHDLMAIENSASYTMMQLHSSQSRVSRLAEDTGHHSQPLPGDLGKVIVAGCPLTICNGKYENIEVEKGWTRGNTHTHTWSTMKSYYLAQDLRRSSKISITKIQAGVTWL